ncbi:MAG: hypothetical protein N2114_01485 [Candidatus Goldbacteria bacterium]|nr:hypothetical protein [Candidatus Goldiibacteriota bacterium]
MACILATVVLNIKKLENNTIIQKYLFSLSFNTSSDNFFKKNIEKIDTK